MVIVRNDVGIVERIVEQKDATMKNRKFMKSILVSTALTIKAVQALKLINMTMPKASTT